jgi:AcrR family transcriptional regulator
MSADDRRETIELAATQVFGERGYHGASIDEIARRSGVTPPVFYDHFASKKALYQRLLERHYATLREIWFRYAEGTEPIQRWIPEAVDDWFAYVEANRFAGRMLFRDTTGDPVIAAMHADVQRASRAQLLPLVEREVEPSGELEPADVIELTWETLRAVLQGLALWWYDHPHVRRDQIVAAAMDAVWIGYERVLDGERWTAPT